MKWVALLLVVAGAITAPSLLSGREEGCDGSFAATSHAGVRGARTPDEALGDLTEGAADVTRDEDVSKGFRTVTFRAYDEDGDLMTRAVVEGHDDYWSVVRAQFCR